MYVDTMCVCVSLYTNTYKAFFRHETYNGIKKENRSICRMLLLLNFYTYLLLSFDLIKTYVYSASRVTIFISISWNSNVWWAWWTKMAELFLLYQKHINFVKTMNYAIDIKSKWTQFYCCERFWVIIFNRANFIFFSIFIHLCKNLICQKPKSCSITKFRNKYCMLLLPSLMIFFSLFVLLIMFISFCYNWRIIRRLSSIIFKYWYYFSENPQKHNNLVDFENLPTVGVFFKLHKMFFKRDIWTTADIIPVSRILMEINTIR